MSKLSLKLISGCFFAAVTITAAIAIMLYNYSGELLLPAEFPFSRPDHSNQNKTISETIPDFYRALSNEKGDFKIIEYPVMVQERFNPIPDYYRYHGKKILNGYFQSPSLKKQWGLKDIRRTDIWPLEMIASKLENNKINLSGLLNFFHNFIDLYDLAALKDSGAKYIILHKHILDDITSVKNITESENNMLKISTNLTVLEQSYKFTQHLKAYYEQYFGNPVYQDSRLIVFEITG